MNALLLGASLLLTACGSTRSPIVFTATATHIPALPPFSDWRIAYLSQDGAIHAVSANGKDDLAGPPLPEIEDAYTNVVRPTISPDGHLLAARGKRDTIIIDLTGRQAVRVMPHAPVEDLAWSPDGSLLAVGFSGAGTSVYHRDTDALIAVPTSSSHMMKHLLGWSDATHLLGLLFPPLVQPTGAITSGGPQDRKPSVSLGLLDVTTGELRTLVTIASPTMGEPPLAFRLMERRRFSPTSRYAMSRLLPTWSSLIRRLARARAYRTSPT